MVSKSRKTTKPSRHIKHDDFLAILMKGRKPDLIRLVEELAEKYNTTLHSILKVENLFRKHIEFNSRSHLLRELNGSMKAPILNTIIARLVSENKLVVNDDHSLTWIDTKGNEKLNAQFNKAAVM